MQCLQQAVLAVESSFELAAEGRKRTLYRLDGGSGTDENLRWLLQRGYQVLAKGFSGKRAQALAAQVQRWDANDDAIWWSSNPIPSAPNRDTFVSLDTIIASNPDAVVLTIAVNQGGGNPGLVTAVDAYSALGTTYDFETVSTPPRSADECRDGGWQSNFAAGEFRNQGDCVSYFASNGRSHL